MTLSPNWLLVLGAVYAMVAFVLLACAAIGGGATDLATAGSARRRQSAAFLFAGIAGMVGFAFQTAGQFIQMGASEAAVLLALGTIPLMLAYLVVADRRPEAVDRATDLDRTQNLSVVGSQRRYGAAAE